MAKLLLVVPARGGSKGLPGKNNLPVGGLSLTARAVLTGRGFVAAAGLAGARVVVDTDDEAIAEEGRRYGAEVPFLRPPALAQDDTPTHANVLACVERLAKNGWLADTVVVLQPTSPLRTIEDVLACWRVFDPAHRPQVVALTAVEHPLELSVRLDASGVLHWAGSGGTGTLRRQDHPPTYRISGAAYVTTVAVLRGRQGFVTDGLSYGVVLPVERSVDVDTGEDLMLADALVRIQTTRTPAVAVGDRSLGAGAPCFVIAEAGVNHNGDAELAHRLVDVAADAGADAVKFQTFDPDQLAAPEARQAAYQVANTGIEESQRSMLMRLVLPLEAYKDLRAHTEERGLAFLSTPFDEGSADFLEALGVRAFKIPSGELTNLPFLAYVARKGRPMLMSSGMCTMAEVAEAVLTVRSCGAPPLALFHCVTSYPAAPEQCNLSAMGSMRAAFGVPVGWSDHTAGIDVSVAAVGMGAELLEKHFTVDCSLPGPDHKASLEPAELGVLIRAIRTVEAARGTGVKAPDQQEEELASLVRKSLHARHDLPAGHRLTAADLIALRPAGGLPPAALPRLVGRLLRASVRAGALLDERDIA